MIGKTINSQQVWQSPDASKKIWEVTLRAENGENYKLKTYSRKISELGFTGELQSYTNRLGDRFVRQKKQPQATRTFNQRDDNAIRAQWAIGQAIALASVTMDKQAITMPLIERYAKQLFATVTRVKGDKLTPEMEAQAASLIQDYTKQPALAV
jgi:hypothetical protein